MRFLLSFFVVTGSMITVFAEEPKPAPKIVGYFTEWGIYQRKFNVADIPAEKITHVNYAFAKIADGECALFDSYAAIDKFHTGDTWDAGVLRGNFRELQRLKAKHKHLKTLISVGGWTLSGPFSDAALTEQSRAKFAKSCVTFMKKYGFDGVDLDWEYPVSGGEAGNKTRPEDKANYTKLLAEVRKQLDEAGKADKVSYLLTIAAPAGPKTFKNLELKEMVQYLDWFNLMAYDFHGSWSEKTNHHSPLFANPNDPSTDEEVRKHWNVSSAVQNYLKAGVPAGKIVVGMPFYGRGWSGAKDANNGLFQAKGAQQPMGTWEAGNWDYKDIASNYVGKKGTRHWDKEAKACWLYDAKTGLMISYDDAESLKFKAEYCSDQKLGGAMIWELSADSKEGALLNAILDGLTIKSK